MATNMFWVSFYSFTSFILLNMFVAIVIESFELTDRDSHDSATGLFQLGSGASEAFSRVWQEVDPEGSLLLDRSGLVSLFLRLQHPLGLLGSAAERDITQIIQDFYVAKGA